MSHIARAPSETVSSASRSLLGVCKELFAQKQSGVSRGRGKTGYGKFFVPRLTHSGYGTPADHTARAAVWVADIILAGPRVAPISDFGLC